MLSIDEFIGTKQQISSLIIFEYVVKKSIEGN